MLFRNSSTSKHSSCRSCSRRLTFSAVYTCQSHKHPHAFVPPTAPPNPFLDTFALRAPVYYKPTTTRRDMRCSRGDRCIQRSYTYGDHPESRQHCPQQSRIAFASTAARRVAHNCSSVTSRMTAGLQQRFAIPSNVSNRCVTPCIMLLS